VLTNGLPQTAALTAELSAPAAMSKVAELSESYPVDPEKITEAANMPGRAFSETGKSARVASQLFFMCISWW
jgi:hypothetical protein